MGKPETLKCSCNGQHDFRWNVINYMTFVERNKININKLFCESLFVHNISSTRAVTATTQQRHPKGNSFSHPKVLSSRIKYFCLQRNTTTCQIYWLRLKTHRQLIYFKTRAITLHEFITLYNPYHSYQELHQIYFNIRVWKTLNEVDCLCLQTSRKGASNVAKWKHDKSFKVFISSGNINEGSNTNI